MSVQKEKCTSLPKSLWENKGFHFFSKAEGKVGLPIFHPWVKGPEEKHVLEILRETLKAEDLPLSQELQALSMSGPSWHLS